jgi:hypothetical protein
VTNLQTDLVGKQVHLVADKRKQMNPPLHRIVAAFVEDGLRVTVSDEYGGLKTVRVDEVELYVSRSW